MKVLDILVVGLVFMALFPTIYNSFMVPTGNTTPYSGVITTIFTIVPLLVVVGLLYYVWTSSQKGHGGGIKI